MSVHTLADQKLITPPCPNCGWPGIMCLKLADCPKPVPLPWIVFEIPCPPSVNRFKWRLGNKSPNVQQWIGQADIAWVITRQNLPRLKCKFEVQFLFGRNSRADFHNFEKPLFDWLQSREFIVNDKLCEWRGSGWSDDVPKGRVVVRLRPWMRS